MVTIALKDAESFVKIADKDQVWYGGDQAWYDWGNDDIKTHISQKGACGVIAAANITAYLAGHHLQYRDLYQYPDYTKTSYMLHMKELYEYVVPWHIGRIPLGVWPAGKLARGVRSFADSRNTVLRPVQSSRIFNRENMIRYIGEGLKKDSPVAMLVGARTLNKIEIVGSGGRSWTQDISFHWVTITEMTVDERHGTAKVRVSTWGGQAELDLDQYLGDYIYQALLYFA